MVLIIMAKKYLRSKKMKLDERFKVLPFCCLSAEKCEKYIGQKGYFTSNIALFKNIDLCIDGTLEAVHGDEAESFEMRDNRKFYRYFIPECFVEPKEKKYRPYTIEEFCNEEFEIVVFRSKYDKLPEYHVRYNGYIKYDNVYNFILGTISYTLSDLFEHYEYLDDDGEWKPFGVEE